MLTTNHSPPLALAWNAGILEISSPLKLSAIAQSYSKMATVNQLNSLELQTTETSPPALPVDICQNITHGSACTRAFIFSFLYFLLSHFLTSCF